MYETYLVAAIVIPSIYMACKKFFSPKSSRQRSMSFNSEILVEGGFPPQAGVASPIINSVLVFKSAPSLETTIEAFSEFLFYDRFRSIAIKTRRGWEFQVVDVDVGKNHISTINVPDEVSMMQVVDDIMGRDLPNPNSIPLWQVVRLVNTGTGNSGILVRIHHVISDGIGLVAVMERIFTNMDGEPLKLGIAESMRKKKKPSTSTSSVSSSSSSASSTELDSVSDSTPLLDSDPSSPRSPPSTSSTFLTAVSSSSSSTSTSTSTSTPSTKPSLLVSVGKILWSVGQVLYLGVSPYDSNLAFSHPNKRTMTMKGTKRVTVYLPSLKLEFVKDLKNAAGVTINDVYLAATAGAIRRYCQHMKDPAFLTSPHSVASKLGLAMRVLMPVAFPRSPKELADPLLALRNKWAFLSVALPIAQTTVRDRLSFCQEATKSLKSSPLAYVQLWIQDHVLPLLPSFVSQQTAFDIFSRHSIVFSNVPGPASPVKMRGHKVESIQVVFPNLLTQVLILSYGGSVFYSMSIDPEIVKDGQELIPRFFLEEIIEMAKELNLEMNVADKMSYLSKKSEGGVWDIIE